jgi:hypothetical protein
MTVCKSVTKKSSRINKFLIVETQIDEKCHKLATSNTQKHMKFWFIQEYLNSSKIMNREAATTTSWTYDATGKPDNATGKPDNVHVPAEVIVLIILI